MPDHDFQPGDVVELKSGGPRMTVTSIRTDEDAKRDASDGIYAPDTGVHCQWFADTAVKGEYFNASSLKLCEDEPPASPRARRSR